MSAQADILARIQPQLERLAAVRLAGESNCSLAPSDLVNESMVRILSQPELAGIARGQVLGWVSHVMRQVLVDHARRKNADKRAHQKVTLLTTIPEVPRVDFLELDLLLHELAEIDPSRAELVEMRFFGGMTIEEIAEATEQSPATVKRRWAATRAFLYHRLLDSQE
jgi:RNA polymerase sigma factor (TIGR02999 family)